MIGDELPNLKIGQSAGSRDTEISVKSAWTAQNAGPGSSGSTATEESGPCPAFRCDKLNHHKEMPGGATGTQNSGFCRGLPLDGLNHHNHQKRGIKKGASKKGGWWIGSDLPGSECRNRSTRAVSDPLASDQPLWILVLPRFPSRRVSPPGSKTL